MIKKEDIEIDLIIGKTIFEDVPDSLKPCWSGLILSTFNNYLEEIPNSVRELYSMIDNENRWPEAHAQFSKIRRFLLDHKHFQPEAFLLLAENAAKVTYNASNRPAPFDADSGWYIPSLAVQTALSFNDARLLDEVKAAILLFKSNKKFKNNVQAAKEFLIYRKIDEILYLDWDPIGVNNIDEARHEYESYLPEIFNQKKTSAKREEIAMYLLKIETERMGLSGNLEACFRIADKIISL